MSLKSKPVTELIKSSRKIGGPILYGLKVLLDSIPKGRDITLLTKVQTVKTKVLPVVTYRGKCWIIKKDKKAVVHIHNGVLLSH